MSNATLAWIRALWRVRNNGNPNNREMLRAQLHKAKRERTVSYG